MKFNCRKTPLSSELSELSSDISRESLKVKIKKVTTKRKNMEKRRKHIEKIKSSKSSSYDSSMEESEIVEHLKEKYETERLKIAIKKRKKAEKQAEESKISLWFF